MVSGYQNVKIQLTHVFLVDFSIKLSEKFQFFTSFQQLNIYTNLYYITEFTVYLFSVLYKSFFKN